MITVTYSNPLTGSWQDWLAGAWTPGVSPVVVFNPILNGFEVVAQSDAQLAVLGSGNLVRIMGTNLTLTGNFTDPAPLPDGGTITGFRIYDRYEPLLVFDDPNDRIVTEQNTLWDGVLLAEVTGLAVDAATLQAAPDPAAALAAVLGAEPQRIIGSAAADLITAGAGEDTINGGDGNDWITPGTGRDTVDGDGGSDMVSYVDLAIPVEVNLEGRFARLGGDTQTLRDIESVTGTIFADFLRGDGADNRIRGLGDYDWIVGSDGTDTIEGGTGRDMISYVYANAGVTVDLGAGRGLAGQAAGDRLESIERATGSIYADLFYGGAGEEDFRGLGGYDWFVGSGGGKDRYDGGSGLDTVSYAASAAGVSASLLLGRGISGDASRDLYTSIERLTGTSFDDTLTGDNGRNVLRGLYGEDVLIGNGGVDYLEGGGNDDTLDGGSGWDVAVFSGARAEYTVSTVGAVTTVARIAPGGDGTDTLSNIEALQFTDDMVFL